MGDSLWGSLWDNTHSREGDSIITLKINSLEASLTMTCRGTSPPIRELGIITLITNIKEASQAMTCKAVNSPTQDPEINTQGIIMEAVISTDPEKGLPVDPVDLEIEPQVETEKLPGRRVINLKITGTMTLAMEVTTEGTARRPCIMGGHL